MMSASPCLLCEWAQRRGLSKLSWAGTLGCALLVQAVRLSLI